MATPDLQTRLERALSVTGSASSDYDLNSGMILPQGRVLRDAAVLIAISPCTETVILTKRSSKLKHHPGQIAFPGGKMDATDATLTDTALREAEEEIGLPRAAVQIMGAMPAHETVTGFTVTPIIGLVRDAFDPVPEAGEVVEVFETPLAHLMDPARFAVQSRQWQGRDRHYYTVPFGPYYIWGATARILRALADRMQP